MSRRHPRDSRSVSDYPPAHHSPAPSLTAQAIVLALAVGVFVAVTHPVLSLVAATALVGFVAVVRVAVARIERDSVNVRLPGLPVRVTFARTAGE